MILVSGIRTVKTHSTLGMRQFRMGVMAKVQIGGRCGATYYLQTMLPLLGNER